MQKPNNYENTPDGSFIPVELGGHYAVIKKVEERQNKNGGDMIVVAFDFDSKDAQAGYFMASYEADIRPDKKWPNQAKVYINVNDKDGNCSISFKRFLSCFEKSNNITVAWGKDFVRQFAGKKIGTVFGEVEETYNGETKMRRKVRWFCEYTKAADAAVPDQKLQTTKAAAPAPTVGSWMDIPEGAGEEIPFDI